MELLIESSCYHVTWKVKDFFQLPSEIGYTLNSPKFHFDVDSYCLQLKLIGEDTSDDTFWFISLLRLTSLTERNVVSRLGFRVGKISASDVYLCSSEFLQDLFQRSYLEKERDKVVPDGTLTLLCCMRFGEQSSSGCLQADEAKRYNRKEKHEGLPGQSAYFNSCWRSTKMELEIESPCQYITLKVPDFSKMPSEIGYFLDSHEFRFEDDSYCLRFYPNGDKDYDTARICYQLVRLTSNFPERNVSYKIGIRHRRSDGRKFDIFKTCCSFNSLQISSTLRSDIEEDRDFYVPDDTLTLVCSMLLKEQSNLGSLQPEESETSAEKEQRGLPETPNRVSCAIQTEVTDNVSCANQRKNLNSVSCAIQTQVPDSVSSEVQTETNNENSEDEGWSSFDVKGVTKLQTDYRQLLQKGQESDACFVVSGKEFHTHRCVLRARSAVFEAMFRHETAEKESGRVVVDDIDPKSFGDFLEYLYTGRIEAGLSDDNALGIYFAADKYDVPTLKSECVAHMRRTLSVDYFCDIVTMALRHNETDLLQQAIQFFKNNMQSIIVTVKWQQFVVENGISANELFIKALVPGKQ